MYTIFFVLLLYDLDKELHDENKDDPITTQVTSVKDLSSAVKTSILHFIIFVSLSDRSLFFDFTS
jgi:hypothetical protein